MTSPVRQYRKKPVTVEAMLLRGNAEQVLGWLVERGGVTVSWDLDDNGNVYIETLEGVMCASQGDYIIRGVNGEFYPCKPDIFEKTYDSLDDEDLTAKP